MRAFGPSSIADQIAAAITAAGWPLGPGWTCEPVLNWGGFLNWSFTVRGRDRLGCAPVAYHVKLSPSAEQARLRRWLHLAARLTQRFHAPPIVGWIDVPSEQRGGLVFEHLEGATWKAAAEPRVLGDVARVLAELHADVGVAASVAEFDSTPAPSLAEFWLRRYRDQYEADLALIAAQRPPFLSSATLDYLTVEARRQVAVIDSPEWRGWGAAACVVCHNDAWADNVWIGRDERWWLLDWDHLGPGDPAHEFFTLVWPLAETRAEWREFWPRSVPLSDELAERMDWHQRAIALDYTIDVVADWILCCDPQWQPVFRPRKQAIHERHLELYRQRWG